MELCKKSWNLQLKGKIGKKFIKNKENIYELKEHWQFIIIFLQLNFFPVFCQVEFSPLPGGAFSQNIYPWCYFTFTNNEPQMSWYTLGKFRIL